MKQTQVVTGVAAASAGLSFLRALLALTAALAFGATSAAAATLTVQTNQLGPTPNLLGYNAGHFYPGSNTREWWRYAGVSGARLFISPSNIEPSDDVAPVGDGVNSQAAFLTRREAIRTNQFNAAYINWSVFNDNYQNNDLAGNNHIKVNFALGELRKLGIRICAQITASQSRLPIADPNDWPNMWAWADSLLGSRLLLSRAKRHGGLFGSIILCAKEHTNGHL